MQALRRYPKAQRRAVAREWAHRSQAVQAAARIGRGPDTETVRRRALDDARGEVVREGVTYRGDGRIVPWQVRRALRGRVNQVEIVVAERVWAQGGLRQLTRLWEARRS